MIRVGTLIVASSFRVLSNPVESISSVREATQNHTRTEKIANFVMPSAVITTFKPLTLAAQTGVPAVRNRTGIEITAAKTGINAVLEKKCLSGIREATAKTIGTTQIAS